MSEELPAADDDYWDEVTTETLRFLRSRRSAHRREQVRSAAYAVYVAVLLVLVYLLPYVLAALRTPQRSGDLGPAAAYVPVGVAGAVLLVVVAAVRDALWRGPALLDVPTAEWLLATPIRRGPLLRPALRRSQLVGAVVGAVLGAAAGVLLRLVGGGGTPDEAVLGAVTGVVTSVTAIGLAGLTESSTGRLPAALRRFGGWLWAVPLLPVVVPGPARPILLGTPMLAPAAVIAMVVAVAADRRIEQVPARVLRARAATVTDVAGSLGTLQPRRAWLLIEQAQGRRPRTWLRLPTPRPRWALWPWRDATALLRLPSRLLWGVLWAVADGVLAARGPGPGPWAIAALVAGYLGAAQFVEAARLDADDPRAVRGLPLTPAHLVGWHLVLPLALLLVVVGSVGAVLGGSGTVPTLLALPSLTGAALVSAYRGEVPQRLMVGVPTPVGDTGPLQVAAWYLRGPVVGIAALSPVVLGELPGWATVTGLICTGAVMIWWAITRARTELRPPR